MSQAHQRQIVYNPQLALYLFWDAARAQYYYYDQQQDQLVYSDRRRIPRPKHITTNFLQEPYGRKSTSAQVSEFTYSESPPSAGNSSYTTTSHVLSSSPLEQGFTGRSGTYLPQPVVPRVSQSSQGLRTVFARDDNTQVETLFATGPKNRISDTSLFRQGVPALRMLMGTSTDAEVLYPDFNVKSPGNKWFTVGRVFLVLWVEPAGESATIITSMEGSSQSSDPAISTGRFNEKIFSKVRRFVVIRENANFCSALPIVSYGRRGVGKPGVIKSDHAIIYTGRDPPQPLHEEQARAGETGMRSKAIRVNPDDRDRDKLDPWCRVDFAKVHTIQHNIKVKSFGMVHPKSFHDLYRQFHDVWGSHLPAQSEPNSDSDGQHTTKSDSVLPSEKPNITIRTGSGDVLQPRGPGPSNSSPVSPLMESVETGASVAQTKDAYQRMTSQGLSPSQALTALVAQLRAASPDTSQKAAVESVRSKLVSSSGEAENHI